MEGYASGWKGIKLRIIGYGLCIDINIYICYNASAMSDNNTHIPISRELKDLIDQRKHLGQSYTGYIRELITQNDILAAENNKLKTRDKKGRFI